VVNNWQSEPVRTILVLLRVYNDPTLATSYLNGLVKDSAGVEMMHGLGDNATYFSEGHQLIVQKAGKVYVITVAVVKPSVNDGKKILTELGGVAAHE
jgi:hypothetical protein